MSSPVASASGSRVCFRNYELIPSLNLLLHDGSPVRIGRRAFHLLQVLVEAQGRTVGKDELFEKVWAGVVIEENNIQTQVSSLRRALREDRDLIATEFGKGYRFDCSGFAIPMTDMAPSKGALPRPLVCWIGPTEQIERVAATLRNHRLVTLIGAPGVGKTRLASEVGMRFETTALTTVSFVSIADIRRGEDLSMVLSKAMRVSPPSGGTSLGDREAHLLIVDSCEHLVEAVAGLIAEALRLDAHLCVLITSREPLGISGEKVVSVQPLAIPPEEAESPALSSFSAVNFIEDHLNPSILEGVDREALLWSLANLVRLLDGLPFAIEIACAYASAFGVSALIDGTVDLDQLILFERRSSHPKERSIGASIHWSLRLLEPDDIYLVNIVADFEGDFSFQDLARTISRRIEHRQAWESLGRLVSKSLIDLREDANGRTFRMMNCIRSYIRSHYRTERKIASLVSAHAELEIQY